jgi:glutamyl-tRNA synthetase
MHIGTARTIYLNWLAAKASGGSFILRVDDTDQNRHNENAVQIIYDAMSWLGLDYDDTFRQSQHKDIGLYDKAAEDLIHANLAYRDDGAIRLRCPDNIPLTWHDEVAGDIAITDKDKSFIDGLVLIKSDGWPTYHFASVIDDAWSGVNYVIRGNDHTSNTAKHIAIYLQMQKCNSSNGSFAIPKFGHVGLIHKNGKKMSKRDADIDPTIFLSYYRENNYEPDAVLNFLGRLGWGPTVDDKTTTILTKKDMLRLFLSGGKMRSAPSNFDMMKLDSFDRKYKARIEQAMNDKKGRNQ